MVLLLDKSRGPCRVDSLHRLADAIVRLLLGRQGLHLCTLSILCRLDFLPHVRNGSKAFYTNWNTGALRGITLLDTRAACHSDLGLSSSLALTAAGLVAAVWLKV